MRKLYSEVEVRVIQEVVVDPSKCVRAFCKGCAMHHLPKQCPVERRVVENLREVEYLLLSTVYSKAAKELLVEYIFNTEKLSE